MKSFLSKYPHRSEFNYSKDDVLKSVCSAPRKLPGVYLIYQTDKSDLETLVYIGMSGTMRQNGTWGGQKLFGRINNKISSKEYREAFFKRMINENSLKKIRIEWYVTFDDNNQDLPAYVEGVLLQEYFNKHKQLPLWNKKF